jgi:hypothetical protein
MFSHLLLLVIKTVLFVLVLKELEGLARGGKDRDYMPVPSVEPEHAAKVAEAAKMALVFLRSRSPGVRCVTTRGTVIRTSAFAMEEDTEQVSWKCFDSCHGYCRFADRYVVAPKLEVFWFMSMILQIC